MCTCKHSSGKAYEAGKDEKTWDVNPNDKKNNNKTPGKPGLTENQVRVSILSDSAANKYRIQHIFT